jgi:hypothetical protein
MWSQDQMTNSHPQNNMSIWCEYRSSKEEYQRNQKYMEWCRDQCNDKGTLIPIDIE